MDRLIYLAMSGAKATMQRQETLANTLANVSTVGFRAELVDMITAQRVYQANAQTIKTQDQLLQTIVNLR